MKSYLADVNLWAALAHEASGSRRGSDLLMPAQKFQLSTDGFTPYNYAVGTQLDERVDYGQLVKIYASPTAEEQRRYSPAHVVEAIATEVYGDPNPDRICTSHIERQNGSLRQWCKPPHAVDLRV
jgi:hypothetical protein